MDIDEYNVAMEIRNFEISLFWKRSNYFLVLNTAVAAGVFYKINIPSFAVPISIFGMIISLIWISVNLGSKYWQDRWERKLSKIELRLKPNAQLFSAPSKVMNEEVKEGLRYYKSKGFQLWRKIINKLVLRKPSVSRSMILLSMVFLLFWIFILLNTTKIVSRVYPFTNSQKQITAITEQDSTFMVEPEEKKTEPIVVNQESLMNFVAVFFGVVLSLTLTAFVNKKIREKEDRRIKKRLVLLISDEVEHNINLMDQMITEASTIVPYYQLESKNKNAGWISLVEHPSPNDNLIQQIQNSYFEYNLINRTLDMIFFTSAGIKSNIFQNNTLPLCNAEKPRSEKLLLELRDWINHN